MKKKVLIIILAIALVIIATLLYNRVNNTAQPAIVTSGIVEGTEVNLASKVAGRISEICCSEGDRVTMDQLVIKLESDDLDAAVEQAEAGVDRAKAEVESASSSVASARAEIKNAGAEIKSAEAVAHKAKVLMEESGREKERAESLYREELLSRESYDRAVASYESLAAEYNSAEARLLAARTGMTSAKAKLDLSLNQRDATESGLDEATANLSYHVSELNDTEIYSPIGGRVVFKAFEVGETVSPGVAILTVVDTDHPYIRTDIDETQIGSVVLDKEIDVTLENHPGEVFRGRVAEIGRYAEFATQRDVVRGRQDIRTFRVKIVLGDTRGILKPGMTVTVTIPK